MYFLSNSAYFFITYILSGTALFIAMLSFFPSFKNLHYNRILYVSFLGIGPITISWLLEKIMYLSPGHARRYYIIIITSLFIFLLLYTYLFKRDTYKKYFLTLISFTKLDIMLSLVILSILSIIIFLPVIGNDPSQYFYIAEILSSEKSFQLYPMINTDYKGYLPWSHPAGYVGLLSWGRLFTLSQHLYLLKTVNIFYAFLTYTLLSELFKQYGIFYARVAALLLFSAPLYCTMTYSFHIDIFRVFFFFISFIFLSMLFKTNNKNYIYLIAIALAMSAHAHSIGILSFFFLGAIILIYGRRHLTLKNILLSSFIVAIIVIPRYYQNYQVLGYIIGDRTPIWALDFINYNEYLAQSRHLDSIFNKIYYGILRGFTHFVSFAYSFWYLLLLSLITLLSSKRRKHQYLAEFKYIIKNDNMFFISLMVILLWYIATVLSTILGSYNFIKNSRYLLTIYPFIIYLSAILTLEQLKNITAIITLKQLKYFINKIRSFIKKLFLSFISMLSNPHIPKVLLLIGILLILLENSKINIINFFHATKFEFSKEYLAKTDYGKLLNSNYSSIKTINYIKNNTNREDIFLIFRTSEFPLYAQRKFISLMDPAIIDIYTSKNIENIYTTIKKYKITYLYLPNYSIPQIFNTKLIDFINDPTYCQLVSNSLGYRLYKIHPQANQTKDHFLSKFQAPTLTPIETIHTYKKLPNHRFDTPKIAIDPHKKYLIETNFSSHGLIDITANESDINGTEFKSTRLYTMKDHYNDSAIMFTPDIKTKKVKFVYNFTNKVPDFNITQTSISQLVFSTSSPLLYIKNIYLTEEEPVILTKMDATNDYYIISKIIGKGLVNLYVIEYNEEGKRIRSYYLAGTSSTTDNIKQLKTLYTPSQEVSSFQIFYKNMGDSQISILSCSIHKVNTKGK